MTEKQEIFNLMDGLVKMHRSVYNPTADAVWLAAVPQVAPKTVLDVGIGTGGVALCLHAHFPDAKITGLDVSPEMLDVCARNAELNNCDIELLNQDILTWSTPDTYDLVVSNPPYFFGTPSGKHPGAHHNIDLGKWLDRCIARVRPQGYFCTVLDAARLGQALAIIAKKCGAITIIPLFGAKNVAERVLVRAKLGSRGDTVLCRGFPMNYAPILRNGLTIQKILSSMDA